ncbi:hypothetical protein TSUD_351830 [Trifolium subterraneum]|uniref:Uncharacterized protein n=1 Tax=Trifolium subterraneum TaxID=3900 RepID=A0A2Z6NR94_TRISU|nr:hypothetical protein TSUD_351830 [Trifolium subterraneum]
MEPSADERVQVSPNVKMEPSTEEEVQPSPHVQMERSTDEGIRLSPNVKMEPSAEEEVQPSPHVQMEPSADKGIRLSPDVKMEPSAEEEVQRNNYELQESLEKHVNYKIDTQTINVDSDEEYESLQPFKYSRKVNKSDHSSDGDSAPSVPPITSKEKSDSLRKASFFEEGSSTESTPIISVTSPRLKQEKANESITSKSSTAKCPSPTKNVEQVSSKQELVSEYSAVDYSKYKEIIVEDRLAMMEKLLSGELSFSSKTSQSTKQAEATQSDRVPINTLLDDLRHLVFSSNLLNYLPNDTNCREKVKGLLFELNDRVNELSDKQVLGLDEFIKIFNEAAIIIDDSRDNADSLQELELNHKNTISKLQASMDKIKRSAESISADQNKIEDIDNQIEDIQTQIQLLKEQVNKLHQEKSLLKDSCSKCRENRFGIMKDIKIISSEAVEILEKTSHLEKKEQEFNLNYKRLQEHYTKMKLAPPF